MRFQCVLVVAIVGSILSGLAVSAAEWGLKEGTPEMKSAGSLAFGPDGILFVGDTKSATVFAIGTGDTKGNPATANINVSGLNAKVAELLGVNADKITINDLAVNPLTGNIFLSVTKAGSAALVKVSGDGKLSQVGLQIRHIFKPNRKPHQPSPVRPVRHIWISHAGNIVGHDQAQMPAP